MALIGCGHVAEQFKLLGNLSLLVVGRRRVRAVRAKCAGKVNASSATCGKEVA